jgi:hypothetical protein
MPRIGGSAISVYGVGRTTVPPVYGGFSNGGVSALGGNIGGKKGCTGCEPSVPYVTTMLDLLTILENLKSAIDKFYPPVGVGMKIDARYSARGHMDIRYMARIEWVRLYKDLKGKFDPTDVSHVNLLKDTFLALGTDWRTDKWLNEWIPP